MHEEQTRGTAQVSHRRMQLAKNSLTSQREDTAAEQRKHARLEDLHGLSYPSSHNLQQDQAALHIPNSILVNSAFRNNSDECVTDANNLLVAKHRPLRHHTHQQQTQQVSRCDVVITSTGAKQRLAPLSTFTHNVFVHHSKIVTLL